MLNIEQYEYMRGPQSEAGVQVCIQMPMARCTNT